jgi:transcriptional regulator with XRE-family HTH domain
MPWAEPEPPRDPIVQKGLSLLGAAMQRARRRKGWSQRDLASRTGVHQSTISRFERGDRVGLRFSRFCMLVGVLEGLDFLPPELVDEPTFTTRRQWLEWANAKEAEWFRMHPTEVVEDDEADDEDPA